MNHLVILARFAGPSVPALHFTPFKLREWAVDAHKEYVEWLQEQYNAMHPNLSFDDVFNDEIVACLGQSRQAAMKALEECGSHGRPQEVAALDAP